MHEEDYFPIDEDNPIVYSPGAWLDKELSESESDDIMKFCEMMQEIKEKAKTTDERLNLASLHLMKYMNSFMHLLYRLTKRDHGLHIESGKVYDKDNKEVDIMSMTIDFLMFSMTKKGIDAMTVQEITLPDEYVYPIDKVTQMFMQNAFSLDQPTHVISGKRKKDTLSPIVTVSLQDLPSGIELSRNIQPYDNIVFRAVCTLHEQGNDKFTGCDIYRIMTGRKNALASDSALDKIHESWVRLTSIAISIDTGNMGEGYNFVGWIRNRRIIEGGFDTVYFQNQHGVCKTTLYTILEEPILKTYAKYLDQISRYSIEEMNTPINKTPEILSIQFALRDHIAAIPNISNHITYDSLFSLVDFGDKSPAAIRKRKNDLRKHIRTILSYWVEIGIIYAFKELKNGNAFYCIEITKTKPKALTTGSDTPKKSVTTP